MLCASVRVSIGQSRGASCTVALRERARALLVSRLVHAGLPRGPRFFTGRPVVRAGGFGSRAGLESIPSHTRWIRCYRWRKHARPVVSATFARPYLGPSSFTWQDSLDMEDCPMGVSRG